MIIDLKDKCSDCKEPVIDIYFSDPIDAFNLGVLFEKISSRGRCVWKGDKFIRIPLVGIMDEYGLVQEKEKE